MSRYPIPLDAVISNQGVPMPGASVLVRSRTTGVNATVYQAETGPGTLTNPLSADASGRVAGWVAEGLYELVITASGFAARTVAFDAGAQSDAGAGITAVSLTTTGNITATAGGDLTVDDITADDFTLDDGTVDALTAGSVASGVLRATATMVDPPVVSSLPGSPTDGQVVDYLVDGAKGIVWRVRYRAASASPYKWEYVGGAELFSETNAGIPDRSFVNPGTYVDFGAAVTVPLAGEYEVEAAAQFSAGGNNLSALVGVKVGATEAVDYDWIEFFTGPAAGTRMHAMRRRNVSVASPNTTLTLRARGTVAYTFASRYASLRAKPIRVG